MRNRISTFIMLAALLAFALSLSDNGVRTAGAQPAAAPRFDHFVYLPVVMGGSAALPQITSFGAVPPSIAAGGSSQLQWAVSDATSLSITPGIGTVSGASVNVQPAQTTQYTLTATNSTGSVTAHATVTVSANGGSPANFFMPYQFNDQLITNYVPHMVIDGAGGTHIVYTAYAPDSQGNHPLYYAYCAANCTSAASFNLTLLGSNLSYAQIAVNANGQPRLLVSTGPDVDYKRHYAYWECNSACDNPGNWSSAAVATVQYWSTDDVETDRGFALDSQGHPRFVYGSSSVATGDTTTFAFCNSACTNSDNWQTTHLSDESWHGFSLAVNAAGLPRLTFMWNYVDPLTWETVPQLDYVECSTSDCASGSRIMLVETATYAPGSQAVASLRLDAQGRPRIAYYPGTGSGGSLNANRLYYLACESQCTAPNWQALDVGLPGNNGSVDLYNGDFGVDLALDAQGRPRIAYRIGGGIDELGYTWCNNACVVAGAVWKNEAQFSTALADAELGHIRTGCPECIPPIICQDSFWDAGYWPSLALDAAGNPRIAYEILLISGGGQCYVSTLARFTRFATFTQPQ